MISMTPRAGASAATCRGSGPRPRPDPATGDWGAWQALLASRTHGATEPPEDAMTIVTSRGFGTVSSSLVGLPAPGGAAPRWLFADGRPDQAAFRAVTL